MGKGMVPRRDYVASFGIDSGGTEMKAADYKAWWNLHVRVSKGESLTGNERTAYDEGLRLLRENDVEPSNLSFLRQTRAEIHRLEEERNRLQERRRELKEHADRLESALTATARQMLGVGD